jgi:c-di-GMP-related signal transduction protein
MSAQACPRYLVSLESVAALSPLHHQAAREHLADSLAMPQNIAPLPRVCAELAQLTARQATDAVQLAKLIQSDPALAGEVMRVANSPALRPRAAVVSLQQAVSWLGVAEVRNIAMAVMLRGEVFVAPGHERESEELWLEAWVAGLWAKEIARERRKHVESAFLSALMHSDWRRYRESAHSDLASTVNAAHLLAQHTLYPQLLTEDIVLESAVFEQLGVFPDERRAMLARRDHVRSLAGI